MFAIDEIYQVSSFLKLCAKTINNNIPVVWISGEVSNFSTPSSGHIYFSLKDNNSQIRCAFFRLSQRNLSFQLKEGMQIMVRAAPSLYEKRGDFQLIIQKVEPLGVGGLELGLEQLKQKLQSQGLFATECKKLLVKFPKKIAVITSKNGAVIQDIINVISNRYPFVEIIIYDTITQGDFAAQQIINAINQADIDNNDTLIIARGGGSREDLWCFNDEELALCVFNAKTPIISSIGHESDSSIVDFVADVYAPTPSAAAMMAVPDKLEILQNLAKLNTRLKANQRQNLVNYKQQLLGVQNRLLTPKFNNYYQHIDDLIYRLNNRFNHLLQFNFATLASLKNKLLTHNPQSLLYKKQQYNNELNTRLQVILSQIKQHKEQVANLEKNLIELTKHQLFLQKHKLNTNMNSLNQLSPLQVLERGYSISSYNNKSLTSASEVKKGDKITTKLANGKLQSIIC